MCPTRPWIPLPTSGVIPASATPSRLIAGTPTCASFSNSPGYTSRIQSHSIIPDPGARSAPTVPLHRRRGTAPPIPLARFPRTGIPACGVTRYIGGDVIGRNIPANVVVLSHSCYCFLVHFGRQAFPTIQHNTISQNTPHHDRIPAAQ